MGREGFGTPGYDGKKGYIKDTKLKTPKPGSGETMTHLIGRLVPQMKSLIKDPDGWHRFAKYHYGHKGTGYTPGKTFPKTFACLEEIDFKTKAILVHCEKCDEIYVHEDAQARLEKVITDVGGKCETKSELETFSKQVSGDAAWTPILKSLQDEKDWLYNNSLAMGDKMYIVTPTDEIVRLQLSRKTTKALMAWLKNLEVTKGLKAMDLDEGVFIDFCRTGTGFGDPVQDTFEVVTKTINHPELGQVQQVVKAPLSDEMLDRILKECTDLAFTETVLTHDQIKRLIEGDGSPEHVDAIFKEAESNPANKNAPVRQVAPPEDEETKPQAPAKPVEAPRPTTVVAGPLVTPKASAVQPEPVQPVALAVDANAALQAQIAALQAQLATNNAVPHPGVTSAVGTTVPPVTFVPATPAVSGAASLLSKSREEFYSQFPAPAASK